MLHATLIASFNTHTIWWRVLGCKPFTTTDTPTALLYVTSLRKKQYTPLDRHYLFKNRHSITSQKTCACNVATTTTNFAFDLPISCDSRYNSGTLRLLCACAAVAYTPRPILLFDVKKFTNVDPHNLLLSLPTMAKNSSPQFALLFATIHVHVIRSVVCLTSPQPLPNPVLRTVQSSASSFSLQYHLFSLRSSTSCLRHPPRLPVRSILFSIFLSITCF